MQGSAIGNGTREPQGRRDRMQTTGTAHSMPDQPETRAKPTVCGAPLRKKPGVFCQRYPLAGRTRCRIHGGLSKSGSEVASFKTGRYSKALPLRLAARYEQARSDPDLHSIRDEIALAETRLQDLLTRADTSDLGHAWLQLDAASAAFERAMGSGDTAAMRKELDAMRASIQRGASDYLLWQEVRTLWRDLADLRLKDHKRLVDLQAMLSIEEANVLLGGFILFVRRLLMERLDESTRKPIFTDIQAYLTQLDTATGNTLVRARAATAATRDALAAGEPDAG